MEKRTANISGILLTILIVVMLDTIVVYWLELDAWESLLLVANSIAAVVIVYAARALRKNAKQRK